MPSNTPYLDNQDSHSSSCECPGCVADRRYLETVEHREEIKRLLRELLDAIHSTNGLLERIRYTTNNR